MSKERQDQVQRDRDKSDESGSDDKDVQMSQEHHMTFKKKHEDIVIPHSPPSFITVRQLTDAANAFYNMSLAHEITVDSDFRIEKYEPPEESLQHVVKETMERAFWDILRESLEEQPPDYGPAVRLLHEIKRSLMGLVLPNQKTLQKLVESTFDMEAVQIQLRVTGQLSLDTYAIQVINLMRQFCAPVRDQDVENLRLIDDPVDAFRQAFVVLEKMHMDLANFTITQMRPYIRQEAVVYERTKFAEFVAAQSALGIDGLRETRIWITEAYDNLRQGDRYASSHASHIPSTSSTHVHSLGGSADTDNQRISLTPNSILLEAYFSLLNWPINKPWPETVIMDQHRIVEIGHQLICIITLTSLVLVVCNFIASNVSKLFSKHMGIRVQPNSIVELKRLVCQAGINVLQTAGTITSELRASKLSEDVVLTVERWLNIIVYKYQGHDVPSDAELSSHILQSAPYGVLESKFNDALVSQIREIVNGDHPVYKLMESRALAFLRAALSSTPSESLPLPPGFSILSDFAKSTNASASGTDEAATTPTTTTQPTIPTMVTGLRPSIIDTPSDPLLKPTNCADHLSLVNLVGRLMPVLAHNRHVFGPQYAEIIQKLLLPDSPPAKVNQFSTATYNLNNEGDRTKVCEKDKKSAEQPVDSTKDKPDQSDVFELN